MAEIKDLFLLYQQNCLKVTPAHAQLFSNSPLIYNFLASGYSRKPVLDIFTEKSGVHVIPPNASAALNYWPHEGGTFGK